MRILLAEDNPMDRVLITRMLEKTLEESHEMVAATSAGETVELCRQSNFDLILLDLHLKDSQGIDTLSHVHQALPDVPIVVLTGTKELAAAALRLGAQDYLVKGELSPLVVARVLRYAIDRNRYRIDFAKQEKHYRDILHQVPAVVWTTDTDLVITKAVGAALRDALNFGTTDHTGKFVGEFLRSSRDHEASLHSHQQALEGYDVSLEIHWFQRYFRVKLVPLTVDDGAVIGVLGIAIDVSEQRELTVARLMQEALRPECHPRIPGYDIYGGSYSALETCGDWFDYLYWRDGSIGLVVGDICGKGYGAAIMSAAVNSYLQAAVETQATPAEIMTLCNRLYCKHAREKGFAQVALMRLHPSDRRVEFVGAGERMLVFGQDGSLKHHVECGGLPFGVNPECEYESANRFDLDGGDILLMLTDGFREAFSSAAIQFGEEGISQVIRDCSTASAQEILAALRSTCLEFGKGNGGFDDMTGIVVKVL